jgi:hypothetical protein
MAGFKVIDYSEIYFGTIIKQPKPGRRAGKFIQIFHDGTEYIVLSPAKLSIFHANILERFCQTRGISGRYRTKKMDSFEVPDDALDLKGGGRWEIDDEKKVITLSGTSVVYGPFDRKGLKEKIKSTRFLKNYTVIIR